VSPAYPVQGAGRLVWAYLGPTGAAFTTLRPAGAAGLDREIGISRLPINWLQIMENSFDPTIWSICTPDT